jgi:two-component system LytT family response regulator
VSSRQGARRLKLVLADDEPLARRSLRHVLAGDPEIEIVAECADGVEVVEAVRRLSPDILVLDVQMPEADGFEALRRLAPGPLPAVVFVTAYDEYAVRAFEQQALDYLLKPYSEDRLREAVERAKARVAGKELSELGRRMLAVARAATAGRTSFLERLAVPKGNRTLLVEVDDVDWFEAAGYYVRVHAGGGGHLVRRSLRWLEERLDPDAWVRVHRSAIVNVRRLVEIRRLGPEEHAAVLRGGREVPVSRAGRDALSRLLDLA